MSKENSNNQQGNNTKQPSKNVNNQSTSINRRGRDTSNHKTKKHQPNKKKTRTYTSRQNNETKNNEQNSANELKGNENLKGGLNIARKVATGNIIGATKSALKFKGNKKVRNKRIRNTIIQMLAPIIIIILLAGSIFAIFGSVFDTVKEVITGVIESIIDVFDGDVTDKPIEITDEQVDTIINSIEDLGVSAEDLKLLGDYDENATDEEKQEELRKYIREFYKAQLVTETLNYHHKENTDTDTYGAVYIYRGTDRSNREELEYISYQDMQELQRSGDPSATKYFTIDSSGNLLIAYNNQTIVSTGYSLDGLGEPSIESNIVFTTVDYRSAISQYTTKMNFLISLTMISQNPEFAAAVADLIKNSRIEISVMDKTTTRVRTEIHSYTLNEKEEDSDEIKSYDDLTYITRTTNVSTEPSINVTYVNTWFCEQSIAYEQINEGPTEISNVTVNGENGSEENGEEQWITNHTINTIETVETVKYLGKAEDVTFTLGQRGDAQRYANGEIEEPTFIGLMETEFRIPYSKRTAEAGSNLVSGAEMLFSLLQKDPELENIETIMRYALYIYSGRDYGVTSLDGSIFEIRDLSVITTVGNLSAFGTTLTREEFIQMATDYGNTLNSSDYNTYIVPYLGDFYDIATSSEYNVNPALVLAHACLETSFGSSNACKNDRNYFGMAHYNGASSGNRYSSVADSIRDYCAWVVDNATPGTSAYSSNLSRGQELAQGNELLSGTPDTNIYVLYCRYAQLGSTHISDEPDFSNPAGIDYYESQGSNWGSGGRIYIYSMYETGGLYTGEYATRCGHPNGSDPTTVSERADYAVYSCNSRIQIAKDIFGNSVFGGEGTTNVGGVDVETYTSSSGKTYVQYKQNVGPWADMNYGGGTIAAQGCSITALAITLSGYGFNYTPADWSGPLISMTGELISDLPGTSEVGILEEQQAYLTVQPENKTDIQNHLKTGNPVIIHVLGRDQYNSSYTSNQHWMVLLDINDDGSQVYVSNPYSTGKNGWDSIDEVLKSLCCYMKVSQ